MNFKADCINTRVKGGKAELFWGKLKTHEVKTSSQCAVLWARLEKAANQFISMGIMCHHLKHADGLYIYRAMHLREETRETFSTLKLKNKLL